MLNMVLTSLIPILVAVIGGLLAILGIKGNIISTARIQWVQDLRTALCEYVEANEKLHIHLLDEKKRQLESFEFDTLSLLIMVNKHGNRIALFLNRSKARHQKSHVELYGAIQQLESELSAYVKKEYEVPDDDKVESLKKAVLEKAGIVLKEAWEDSKAFRFKELVRFRW